MINLKFYPNKEPSIEVSCAVRRTEAEQCTAHTACYGNTSLCSTEKSCFHFRRRQDIRPLSKETHKYKHRIRNMRDSKRNTCTLLFNSVIYVFLLLCLRILNVIFMYSYCYVYIFLMLYLCILIVMFMYSYCYICSVPHILFPSCQLSFFDYPD